MPLTYFCPHSGCGAAVQYDVAKPTTCPRCKRAFAAAFKAATPAPTTVVHVPSAPPVEHDEPSLTRTALEARRKTQSTTQVKPRARRGEMAANQMTPYTGTPASAPEPSAELPDDEGDDQFDPRAAKRLARELAATIDPSTIIIEDDPDRDVFRFEEFVEEAKRKPAAKGKKRR